MDIHNPLKGICRGVEADILNYLTHYPSYEHPSAIARKIGRSKSETIKCLHYLSDSGIITRSLGSGRAYSILDTNTIGQILLQFADLPHRLARELEKVIRERGDIIYSATLAPESWCVTSGRTNLCVIVLPDGHILSPHLYYDLMKTSKETFHVTLSILHGTREEVRSQLYALGINTLRWPYCRSTKGPRLISGDDLLHVLGGTGGI